MFVFLSKKLVLPGGVRLRCVAWHGAGEWVACGGENGLLKVFRFGDDGDGGESGDEDDEGQGLTAVAAAVSASAAPPPPSIRRTGRPRPSHHQTLEGHSAAVVLADFCEPFGKLATADQSGFVMVWSLRTQATGTGGEGPMLWEEEAVHRAQQQPPSSSSSSRKRGDKAAATTTPTPVAAAPRATALRWSPNGERLALAYSDGSAMVASVDGHRLWHARITGGCPLVRVCWRPDGRVLLAAWAAGGAVTAHDALTGGGVGVGGGGSAVSGASALGGRVTLHCCQEEDKKEGTAGGPATAARIAALEWHWSKLLGGGGAGLLPPSTTAPSDPSCLSSSPSSSSNNNQRHALLIVCSNGLLQLMRGESDDGGAVCVDTGLSAPLRASWAPDGATFAVSGLAPLPPGAGVGAVGTGGGAASAPSSSSSVPIMVPTVQLYTSAGEHLHTFRVDAGVVGGGGAPTAAAAAAGGAAAGAAVMPIEGLAWEGAGPARSRLSLAVGPSLLLANVRRPHLWARFGGGTITFAAAAAAGAGAGDGGSDTAAASHKGQAQRLVIADAGALLAAIDCDRRNNNSSSSSSSSGRSTSRHTPLIAAAAAPPPLPPPPPPRLPRPRVFIKGVPHPCSRADGSCGDQAASIVNMASAGDLCAVACSSVGGGGLAAGSSSAAAAAAAGRCRLALVDAAGEAVATQGLPAGASARFLAAARWGRRDGEDELNDEQKDVFGDEDGGGKDDNDDGNDDDDEERAAAAVVAAAGEDGGAVFVWWWRRRREQEQQQQNKTAQCWGFHVDHLPLPSLSQHLEQQQQQQQQHPPRPPLRAAAAVGAGGSLTAPVQDHITAIALSRTGTRLLIGRESGVVAEYALAWEAAAGVGGRGSGGGSGGPPTVELRARHLLRCCPSRLEFNSDCSLVAVIDNSGNLSLLALPPGSGPQAAFAALPSLSSSSSSSLLSSSSPLARSASRAAAPPPPPPAAGKHLAAVRCEVWDVCWSSDEPLKLAVMEREQLRVLCCPSLEPEATTGEEGDGGGDGGDDSDDRGGQVVNRRWRRGMPHLLEYGSLRVVGIALDSLVAAAAVFGQGGCGGGGGGDGTNNSSSIASSAADLLASGRAVFAHETEVLRRARELVAKGEEHEEVARGGAGSGRRHSRSSSSTARVAAEVAALWASSSSSSGNGGSNINKQHHHHDLHPRLSRLLADHALACGDLAMAERALRACGDYGGVLLARRGALLLRQGGGGEAVAAAEAALLRREFSAAERAYCQADRSDLAIAMRQRLGCDRRAEELLLLLLLPSSGIGGIGGSDGGSNGGGNSSSSSSSNSGRSSLALASADLTACWHRQARAAAERRRWSRAGRYLALCLDAGTGAGAVAAERDAVRWLHLSGAVGGWDRLEHMAASPDRGLPDGSPLLAALSARLQSAGLARAAAAAVERGAG